MSNLNPEMEYRRNQHNQRFADQMQYMATVRGISCDEIAARTGIHPKRLRRIWTAESIRGPTLLEVALIARVLSIRPNDLAFI